MIKHWYLNNNKLTPPSYHLSATPQAKQFLHELSKGGMIYEQTGHFQPLKHQILVGLSKGFLDEGYKYTNRADITFQLPRELTPDGVIERNVIIKRLLLIKDYLNLIRIVSIPILMLSALNLCLCVAMSMIIYQMI